jgi:histidine phosphatase superfamily protein (branch 1)
MPNEAALGAPLMPPGPCALRLGVTIYFLRHGETDWNRALRYQGQHDIPLNEQGRAQARRNGEALRALLPDIAAAEFVASPLSRARETMEIARAGLGLAPSGYRVDDRLKELHYGHWEGQLAADLPALDPTGRDARRRSVRLASTRRRDVRGACRTDDRLARGSGARHGGRLSWRRQPHPTWPHPPPRPAFDPGARDAAGPGPRAASRTCRLALERRKSRSSGRHGSFHARIDRLEPAAQTARNRSFENRR